MKTQKVIKLVNKRNHVDDARKIWDINHEEKRKNILWNNAVWYPIKVFILVSIIYFLPIIFNLLNIFNKTSVDDLDLVFGFIGLVFNLPYYIFDLRIGIISSLASLLLSLFVSVGKFADGENGVFGEARRAAYRQFAKFVGYVIFIIFSISFWHGLWAGYFNGTSYAPAIFGGWRVGPGWGKLIVAEDMNLARYGEMPLWVMLFFAWFTLVSSLMLTYNEKDTLVENASILHRGQNLAKSDNSSVELAYRIIHREDILAEPTDSPMNKKHASIQDYKLQLSDGVIYISPLEEIVLRNREYAGFRVKIGKLQSLLNIEWVKIAILCCLAFLVSMFLPEGIRIISLALFGLVLIISFLMNFVINNVYLFSDIYRFNASREGSESYRILEFLRFYGNRILTWLQVWLLVFLVALSIIGALPDKEFYNSINNLSNACNVLKFFALTIVIAWVIDWCWVSVFRSTVSTNIEQLVFKYFPEEIDEVLQSAAVSQKSNLGDINYILMVYVYCMLKNTKEIYSEYALENNLSKSKK